MGKKIRGDQQITSAGTILVVDDEEDFLWATDTMLQKAGYSVIQAKNGEKVLKLLEKDIPDLILMDYRLPNRNGLQVAADVKQRIPTVPIIMLTGYAEVGSAVEAMKIGVYDYVTKPVDIDDLLFTIKRCLEKQDLIEEVERLRKALEELERLITTISTRFINLSSDEIDSGISEAVKEIGAFTDVDRSYAFVLSDNGTKIDDTYEWCAEGVKPQTQNLKGISINDELPWFAKRLKEFEVVHVPCVADLRPEASDEKEYFQAQDVQSLLAIPMTYGGSLAGFLRFDSTRANKKWTEGIIALLGVVGEIFINALERKRTEVALQESEERYRTVADFTYDWEYWLAPDGHFIYISPSCERITGYSSEEFVNDPGLFEKIIHPDDHSTVINHLGEEQSLEKSVSIDFRIITRRGEERWISHVCQAVYGADKTYLGRRASNRDISKRKQMQEELLKSRKMEAIATLAGGVAHEFNNALMGIMGNIELLKMDLPEEKRRDRYFEAMRGSGHRMSRLTDQLLAYAQGGKYQPKNLKLDAFVIQTLQILQHDLSPEVRVETHFSKDISHIKADNAQMQMVLSAILANSNEAIEDEGLIRITAENKDINEDFTKQRPGLKPGYYVCLTIKDDGKGMDEETISGIFEPFFTTKFQGRGMGMAAVYGIVKNHHGWIYVDSELGKGTLVQIYLPAIEIELKKPEKAEVEIATGSGTILMIEDEDVVIEVTQAMLEWLGYRVMVAKTGKDAIHIAETFDGQIDLALLDIKLPDIEGGKVYPLIMKARPDLKVVIFSGYAIYGPARKILDAGAQDFIQKPFSLATLSEKLKKVLEGK